MGQLIQELKRRNVIKVAIAYAIAAWLLIEVTATTFPILRLPEWTATFVTVLLMIGFPLALIFAWAFELTPEGLKRENDVDRSQSITHSTGRKLDFVIIGAMAVALLYFAVTHDWSGKQEPVEPGEITSIVVLPLDNLMNDPQQDYFVDGMHEALITELSKIQALNVISRTSALRYRNTEKSVPEIALELGADAIVEGSVLRAGSRVRVTAQLIEARSDHHLWADNFDRELSDILALHSDLARAIVGEIRVAVTPEEESRFANAGSVNPEVYELYLKGRYFCGKGTPEGMGSAIQYLQQAIARDPGYAPAHAELASCYTDNSYLEYLPPLEVYPKAKAAAIRALSIDDQLAEAHTALAAVYYQMEWKFLEAEKSLKRAIELHPNNLRTLIYYAWMLGETGRFEEGMVPARRAQALDPLSVMANIAVAEIYYLSRNYDEAIKEYSKNLDLSPNDPLMNFFLAWPYEQKGMFKEAIALLERAVTLSEGAPVYLSALGHTYALAGKRDEALKILDQLQDPSAPMAASSFHIALVHVGLGNDDSAFQLLEDAFREKALHLIYLKVGPKFDRLRSDSRFEDLLNMMETEQ
jgi:TolB-like protein/tetratricopeptide (TPR) repeat protein